MSKIVCALGIVLLIFSLMIAGLGIGLSVYLELQDDTALIEGDDNQLTGNEISIFHSEVLIGLGVVIASVPVSLFGLALIIMGILIGFCKEMKGILGKDINTAPDN